MVPVDNQAVKPTGIDLSALSDLVLSSLKLSSARVRIGFPFWLAPFMAANVLAITLGRGIYLSGELMEKGRERIESTLRHELEHVRQVQQHGLVRFLYVYLRDYLRLRSRGLDSGAAYAAIPFEIEALEAERMGFPVPNTYNQFGD